MIRVQIQLTEAQHRRLKRWASRLGISLAEAVRRCVSDRLETEGPDRDREALVREAWTVIGKYKEQKGRSSVGPDHDEHLAKGYRK
jgi:hypothetical protein